LLEADDNATFLAQLMAKLSREINRTLRQLESKVGLKDYDKIKDLYAVITNGRLFLYRRLPISETTVTDVIDKTITPNERELIVAMRERLFNYFANANPVLDRLVDIKAKYAESDDEFTILRDVEEGTLLLASMLEATNNLSEYDTNKEIASKVSVFLSATRTRRCVQEGEIDLDALKAAFQYDKSSSNSFGGTLVAWTVESEGIDLKFAANYAYSQIFGQNRDEDFYTNDEISQLSIDLEEESDLFKKAQIVSVLALEIANEKLRRVAASGKVANLQGLEIVTKEGFTWILTRRGSIQRLASSMKNLPLSNLIERARTLISRTAYVKEFDVDKNDFDGKNLYPFICSQLMEYRNIIKEVVNIFEKESADELITINLPTSNQALGNLFSQLNRLSGNESAVAGFSSGSSLLPPGSTSETLLADTFELEVSLRDDVVTREGIALFQREILLDVFRVSSVKAFNGAYIVQGSKMNRTWSYDKLIDTVDGRIANSSLQGSIDYFFLEDARDIDTDKPITELAWDMMSGPQLAFAVYPKSWNTSYELVLGSREMKASRSQVSTIASVLTSIYAANRFDFFNEAAAGQIIPLLPQECLYLSLGAITVPIISATVEKLVGASRGVKVVDTIIPALFKNFNYGSRSLWLTTPKSRNDVFDIAFSTVAANLLMSVLTLYLGIANTISAAPEVLKEFPSIPISMIQTSSVVVEILSSAFANMKETLGVFPMEGDLHLHWLTIVGIGSFINTMIMLIPIGRNPGARMTLAMLGLSQFELFQALANVWLSIFFISSIFTFNDVGENIITKSKLLFEVFIFSFLSLGLRAGNYWKVSLPIPYGSRCVLHVLTALIDV
jgi:hypothetical protein